MADRSELLTWVNETLHTDINRLEDLSSGWAYCKLLNEFKPNSIPLHTIISQDQQSISQNFILLKEAFKLLGFRKKIKIKNLVQGKIKDTVQLLRWLKNFQYQTKIPFPLDISKITGRPPLGQSEFSEMAIQKKKNESLKIDLEFYKQKLQKIEEYIEKQLVVSEYLVEVWVLLNESQEGVRKCEQF